MTVIPYGNLDVVGRGILQDAPLPQEVLPVYLDRTTGKFILPHHILPEGVTPREQHDSFEDVGADLRRIFGKTFMDRVPTVPAQPGYSLVIDESGVARYLPAKDAARHIQDVATQHLERAKRLLGRGAYEPALEAAVDATLVQQRYIEGYAYAVALHLKQGEIGMAGFATQCVRELAPEHMPQLESQVNLLLPALGMPSLYRAEEFSIQRYPSLEIFKNPSR